MTQYIYVLNMCSWCRWVSELSVDVLSYCVEIESINAVFSFCVVLLTSFLRCYNLWERRKASHKYFSVDKSCNNLATKKNVYRCSIVTFHVEQISSSTRNFQKTVEYETEVVWSGWDLEHSGRARRRRSCHGRALPPGGRARAGGPWEPKVSKDS